MYLILIEKKMQQKGEFYKTGKAWCKRSFQKKLLHNALIKQANQNFPRLHFVTL